jgi:hypothetical protein
LEIEGVPTMEDLGKDKNGNQSSKNKIKSGPNRGFRHIETAGKWKYIDGYCDTASASERYAHSNWSKALIQLGHKIGKSTQEGVTSFYVWIPK